MIVSIPVHPLSKKIILKDLSDRINKDGQVHINADMVYGYHLHIKHKRLCKISVAQKLLTEVVTFVIPKRISVLKDNEYLTGLYLYKTHMQYLIQYIEAQVHVKTKGAESIRNFYHFYDLSDDDLSQDSVSRAWRRFVLRRKKQGYYKEKTLHKPITVREEVPSIPLLVKDIHQVLGRAVRGNLDLFWNAGNSFDKRLLKKMRVALYYDKGKLLHREIAEIEKVSRPVIGRHIQSFRDILDTDIDIKSLYDTIAPN